MEKVVSFFTLQIPPGNYFLEDILYIYELLASDFEKVVISTEQVEFENLEEVKAYKEPIKRMSIKAHDAFYVSYFSVEIDTWVIIYSNVDTVLARGVAEKIADLAKKRVKPFNIVNRTPSLNLSDVIIIAISLFFPITGGYFLIKVYKPIVGSFFIGVSILLSFWFFYVNTKRKSTIKLIHKYESPNFFKANSDKIIIAIIAAIIGGIINFLFSMVNK